MQFELSYAPMSCDAPLGRGVPSDIANGVLYFVTEDSRYVTGQTLFIEGGYLIPPISEI